MLKMSDEGIILNGGEPIYTPEKGGVGFELFRCMQLNKNKIAQYIIETGETSTFHELLERSIRIAIYLQSRKLGKEDVVCLCSHNQIHSGIPFFASKFTDVGYASIEPTMSEEDLVYLLDYVKPKILFVTENVEEKMIKCLKESNVSSELIVFGKSKGNIEFDDLLKPVPEEEHFTPVMVENLHETAIIFFSSGTTGTPKGICISHYALLSQAVNAANNLFTRGNVILGNYLLKIGDEGVNNFLTYSPMYWISGVVIFLITLFNGGVRTVGSSFDAVKCWQAIEKYKPNIVFLPPGQIVDLYLSEKRHKENFEVEVFVTGGGPVKDYHMNYLMEMFPKVIPTQIYGSTEMTSIVIGCNVRNATEIELQKKYPGSCIRFMSGVSAKIVDVDTGRTCGLNEQGEVRIKTKYIMNGYYKMDCTSEFDSEGWFKTGDLAFFNEDKCLTIVDRLKELLLYGLYNIRPSVIENILAQHPSVHESFVIGIPHPKDNQHPMGVVKLKQDYKEKVTPLEIQNFVNEKVPSDRYKIRAGIKIVDEIVKTPTGKIRKLEMKRLIVDGKI